MNRRLLALLGVAAVVMAVVVFMNLEEVVVDGYHAKDGTNKMNAREITLPDGRKLFAGASDTGAPAK